MPFFVLFVLTPLAEILVFIKVSGHIGLGTALLMALLTAILGGALVKYQGMQTLATARQSLQRGAVPSKELFDGLCIVAAGATLITPGFITDIIGFALLVPAIRDRIRGKVSGMASFSVGGFDQSDANTQDSPRRHDPDVIDVEYETIDEHKGG